MNKRFIFIITLIATICFLSMGLIFKSTADDQKGVQASVGAIIDGEFVATETGRIGANQEKYESFNTGSTLFFILTGITGVICIVSYVSMKRSER